MNLEGVLRSNRRQPITDFTLQPATLSCAAASLRKLGAARLSVVVVVNNQTAGAGFDGAL
jgi:hypothetical protein